MTQSEVVVSVKLSNRMRGSRQHNSMFGTTGPDDDDNPNPHYFPAGLNGKDDVHSVRPGDALFAFVDDLSEIGADHAVVFNSLNGIDYTNYSNSFELSRNLKFIGWSGEESAMGDISRSRLRMSAQASIARTVVHSGDQELFMGDLLAFEVPYYNMYPQYNEDKVVPNEKWARRHSKHPDTSRIVPKLTKITPESITGVHKPIFWTLLANTDASIGGRSSFFPTASYLPLSPSGSTDVDITRVKPMDSLSIAMYNNAMISALVVIETLLLNGDLRGKAGKLLGGGQRAPDESLATTMRRIADLVGFYGDGNLNKPTVYKKKRKKTITEILYKYFFSFLPKGLKSARMAINVVKDYDKGLQAQLYGGARSGQDIMNKVLLDKMSTIIGRCTKGGLPGEIIDGDFRPGILF
ncbi:MAG: hypothetical protein ACTSUE_04185 [Promethearchaeota archaeon]